MAPRKSNKATPSTAFGCRLPVPLAERLARLAKKTKQNRNELISRAVTLLLEQAAA